MLNNQRVTTNFERKLQLIVSYTFGFVGIVLLIINLITLFTHGYSDINFLPSYFLGMASIIMFLLTAKNNSNATNN